MRAQHARSRWGILALALATGLTLAVGSAPAQAKSVTYTFSGTFDDIPDQFASLFTGGNSFSGSYTVETETPADFFIPGSSSYNNAVTDFRFSIAGYEGSGLSPTLNLADGPDFSQYYISTFAITTDTPWPSGITLAGLALNLADSSGSMLDGVALPQTDDLNDSQFNEGAFQLFFVGDFLGGTIHTFAPVPTPTAALAGLGLLSALGLVRGSRRVSRHGSAA